MVIVHSIIFNGLDSYSEIGLAILNRPNIPHFKKQIEEVNIPGGEVVTFTAPSNQSNEGFENGVLKVDAGLYNVTDIKAAVRKLKAFFKLNDSDNIVSLSDDAEYFYKVIDITFDEIINTVEPIIEVTVNFLLRPCEYTKAGKRVIQVSNNFTYKNTGTIYSRPLLKITGTGNVQITINNETFQVKNIVDSVIIDSSLYEAYSNTVNFNSNMIGNFPILSPGNNIISYTGNITKFEMTPNTRNL